MEGHGGGGGRRPTHPGPLGGSPSPPPQPSRDGPSGGAPDSAGDTAFIWFAGRLLDGGVQRQSRQPWCHGGPPARPIAGPRTADPMQCTASGCQAFDNAVVTVRLCLAGLGIIASDRPSDRPARGGSQARRHVHPCRQMHTQTLCPSAARHQPTSKQQEASSKHKQGLA